MAENQANYLMLTNLLSIRLNIFFAATNATNTVPCFAKLLDIEWHDCAAHTLQLAINAALNAQKSMKNLINYDHAIAGFFIRRQWNKMHYQHIKKTKVYLKQNLLLTL